MIIRLRGAGPVLAMALGLATAVLCSLGYTQWAIGAHSRQACSEIRILATAPGAVSSYDRTIRGEYQHLYRLRCG